jgi:hypothetical protein
MDSICGRRTAILLLAAILLGALLAACNMPRRGATPTVSGADLIETAAAQTVAARFTEISRPPATGAGGTPAPGFTFVPPTALPSATPRPPGVTSLPPSATALPCDQAAFVKDVTIPDNSEVTAGSTFTKTWRLQNAGSCTWTSGYSLVFVNGARMEAASPAQLTGGTVAPGQNVDVSVAMKAPADGGTYRGDWKLRNPSNALFGLGPSAQPFYVQIKVPVKTGLLFDFLSRADEAQWTSGVSGGASAPIAFGGADENDAVGTAKIVDGVMLETGSVSSKVLLTFPRHDNNGAISGLYPAYMVQNGDRLRGRLGFIANADGACGAGKVKFRINYKEGSTVRTLEEWEKSCDGSFIVVDIDLSSLKGKSVQFALAVLADGSFQDDWAIWSSLRIEHK